MPPNNDSQSTHLLTTHELDALSKLFDVKKKQLVCNNAQCSTSAICRHGTTKNTSPPQPQFRCTNCTTVYTAHQMQQLLSHLNVPPQHHTGTITPTLPPHDANMNLEATTQPFTDFITHVMNELKTQRERLDQHDMMYAEIQHLKADLQTANDHIVDLEDTNRQR
ncbi:hypothetical protein BDB00DRAFT_819719 [Zychaea mexicana]|uniref:uncharacterized protein n=1 Tax=Zychaea mexicana TaxID=64656 RepID=UPI0022FE5007|nr:uncharacterized protein BDB00DRAFT_819719 [Zychaea mexicana]KAI9494131.1 hypothetical protein BDB00DRAFT_819719 [Zychaea mexicana]